MKLEIALLALAFPLLCQAQDCVPLHFKPKGPDADKPPMALRQYLGVSSDEGAYGVALYDGFDTYRVELTAGTGKTTLSEDLEGDGGHGGLDLQVSPADPGVIVILTRHPTQTPGTLLVYRRRGDSGLKWERVYEKELTAKFDALLSAKKDADWYNLSLEGWSAVDGGQGAELVIGYRAVNSPRDGMKVVIDKTLLFNPATGKFREKK